DIFKRCYNLRSAEFYHLKGNGQSNDMDSVFTDCKSLVSVTSILPPEISKIGYSCFDGCESLTTLSLPQTDYLINETAFRNCAALESLDLANVTSIGTKAFNGCNALTSISLSTRLDAALPVASEDAFDASHFTNIELKVPDEKYQTFFADDFWGKFSIKHPSLFAFKKVTDGYSVSKSEYALDEDFVGMLEIPAKYESGDVVAIEENAFNVKNGLTGVTIPEGVESIGANAFAGCSGINTVINKRTVPLTEDACPYSAFYSYDGTLTVPFGSLDAYKNTAPWSNFSSIEQGFGERTLSTPESSLPSGEFNRPFELTLTNPNEVGSIYYYIVSEDEAGNGVHQTFPYTNPIAIPDKSCTVWAYISDDITCSEPISFEYTYVRLPAIINVVDNIPQGTQNVDFTAISEQEYLNNVVIDNIYYSITDKTSGCLPTAGLVLNEMSSIDDIHQFNRDIQENRDTYNNFNGIAVKVKGTGSITFNAYANHGNARLTLLLDDGEPVDANDLTSMKYEFSTTSAKYLYIFASPSKDENTV
ncbi:MAG: leucine-rich repeat protein, partial [Candidatus Limisoma sp.]